MADARDHGPDDTAGREDGRYIPGPLARRMGIEIVVASPERVRGYMPVEGNTQPHGILHGGASCVLAETLGSIGAALHAGSEQLAVGIETNATHHRAVASGTVTGVATPVHLGRSLATYEIVIREGSEQQQEQEREQGRRVCTARLSCALRAR